MEKPVILFLIDTLNTGGAERSLLDIISRFRTYRPVMCHLYPGDVLKKEFLDRGIEVHSLNIPPPYNLRKARKAVRQLVTKLRPVVIHSSLFKSDVVSRSVASVSKVPLVNSLVNNSYHESRFSGSGLLMNIKLRALQGFDGWTARKVDLFISNSETIGRSNSKALGIPMEKIKVIYRGRNKSDFEVDEQQVASLRTQLGIPAIKKIILNVSRLIPRKGQLDLVRAFAELLKTNTELHLLIAGEGPFRRVLEAEIKHLGLEANITLLGNRSDIPVLMALADCFVFPTYYEGLPGVLIEAMFAHLPIIASDIPENLECIDENTAITFHPGDERGLMTAISAAFVNEGLMAKKADCAYRVANEKFAIDAIAEAYERTYDELSKKN